MAACLSQVSIVTAVLHLVILASAWAFCPEDVSKKQKQLFIEHNIQQASTCGSVGWYDWVMGKPPFAVRTIHYAILVQSKMMRGASS